MFKFAYTLNVVVVDICITQYTHIQAIVRKCMVIITDPLFICAGRHDSATSRCPNHEKSE